MKYTLLKQGSFLFFLAIILVAAGCEKNIQTKKQVVAEKSSGTGHLQQTKTYSADVVVKWLNMQLNVFRLPLAAGTSSGAADRAIAYGGIALYEAVVPGMPAYRSLAGQLNQLPAMPETEPGMAYHWAASANAALAYMNRHLYPNTSAANKAMIDQLENELATQYAGEVNAATLERSIAFGRAVAAIVFNWSTTDGTATMPPLASYILPVGPGQYEKTPPSFPTPVNPFHQLRRQMVAGSRDGAGTTLPFPYSATPGSDFYKMAKEVYDLSQNLTTEQYNIAMYHAEGSGYGGGSSMFAQLSQILSQTNSDLTKAALIYAKAGIGSYEALTFTFMEKYRNNVLRPITYIRNVMGYAGWNALFGTPPYPEYPAGHPTNGGVLVAMLSDEFGANFSFDFDFYNYLGRPARHYDSPEALGQEMSIARVYAGIHFKPGVYAGLELGKKVSTNILSNLHFLK